MATKPVTRSAANKIACDRCKGRKVRCEGGPGEDCPACVEANMTCSYREVGKMRMYREAYVEGLKARIDELEVHGQGLQSDRSIYGIDSELILTDGGDVGEDYNAMFTSMETSVVSRTGKHTSVGSGASLHAIKLSDRSQNLSLEFRPQDEGDEALWRKVPNPVSMHLPRKAVARHLYQSQYVYIGTIFAFSQRAHFEDRLEHFSEHAPDLKSQESCLGYCQLLLVYAYGELYSINQWTSEGPPGLHFFKIALQYMPNAHEPGSVLFVEVLSMVGYYFQILNRRDAAFLYIGMALRMAISLGLHQELGDAPNVNLIDREHRRRVWWSVYSMDRIITVKFGNPITVHDGDIGVLFPSPLKKLDGDDLSVALVLSSYCKLSRILGKIGEDIYRRKHASGNALLEALQLIMDELSRWWRDRPAQLKINTTTMHIELTREAVSTYLHFYQCVNMTVRPLLFSVTQKRLKAKARPTKQDWKDGLPTVVVSNIENSITAAQSSAQIMRAAIDRNLLATYGFMDGEHAFSSALTLVMANIALDNGYANSSAMETALLVLRSMAEKGNRYVEYRLGLLQNLSSTIPSRSTISQASNEMTGTANNISPLDIQEVSSNYATPPGIEDQLSLLPDFLQPVDLLEHDMPFDMNMENDAHMGFVDDQGWIENTQYLQEQFYD